MKYKETPLAALVATLNRRHVCRFYLTDKSAKPDAEEEDVLVETLHYVPLTVYLPRVDLIEQSHHNECIEYHSEMHRRLGASQVYPALKVPNLWA